MAVISERIAALQSELGVSAGTDPAFDRFRVGAIGAYTDLLNIQFEEVGE